ncbi:hypothetical protein D4Q52_05180 [Rhodopseudomonas palustris]|uniref:Uncharacterized protein n=1 Tax=Rhodopseudomonas palustris TaxID=1076 RepID=A0A418VK76_RHOPL|nr:hypothetical protein D4Q52_05180 [Rhodopseudomonas palustris]
MQVELNRSQLPTCLIYSQLRHGRACPGHPRLLCISASKAWMPGTRPGMTRGDGNAKFNRRISGQALRMRTRCLHGRRCLPSGRVLHRRTPRYRRP